MPTSSQDINVPALAEELRSTLEGEVQFDDGTRALYATDSSNYRQVPIGVVSPKSRNDVIATIAACRKFGAPLLSRGAGTSLAGQCCNVAVIIDWKKHLNRILEINPGARYARVEPGAVCDDLRRAAAGHSLTWGPDPATHTHCTFGGMLGNNSCGVHSQMAGKAVDNILEMDVLLYDGTCMRVGSMSEDEFAAASRQPDRTGEIYRRLRTLRDRYSNLIRERFPRIPRRVSGYNLDELLPAIDGTVNLARALVGSESTCVTILQATVRLIPQHTHRVLAVLGYPDIFHAADHVPEIVNFNPIGLEGFDIVTAGNIRRKKLFQQEYLPLLPAGEGWLMVEFGSENPASAADQCSRLVDLARTWKAVDVRVYFDPPDQQKIWAMRESALGANSFVPGDDPSWEGWEDSAVLPEKLGSYLRELDALIRQHNYRAALYGHFGQGCVHNRINFDFQTREGVKKFRAFIEDAVDLVLRYGGSLSGEHGDGQARGEFLQRMFGPELIDAFREFKSLWDPDWKMNPGKLIDAKPIDSDLRLLIDRPRVEAKTHFAYPDSGRFSRAVDRCVGVGKCTRKEGAGDHDVMCPSYMATREERHSTRGRARLLSEMLRGDVLRDGWGDQHVKEALDLCLSCKGCKADCPVNVDMATYKAEFLSHYWDGRMRPLNAYAFGWIDKWARLAAHAPSVANLLSNSFKGVVGVHSERQLPKFARQSFRNWYRQRQKAVSSRPKVLLFPDTFNNYFRPETAIAAVEVLEQAGYWVEIPDQHVCCGRPLYDHGFLDLARSYLLRTLNLLAPYLDAGTPAVILEPSCCSVFRDELPNLMPDSDAGKKLAENSFTLAEFLSRSPNYVPSRLEAEVLLQEHCHAKSVLRGKEEGKILVSMGVTLHVPEAGCCGMAGAFGYESDKYDVSVACAERVLLPAVRASSPSTLLVADGFSCREQIEQLSGRKTLHLAELLHRAVIQPAVPESGPLHLESQRPFVSR